MSIINNLVMRIGQNNVVVYPNTVGQAVYMNIDNGYTLPQALNDIRNNAVSEWVNILNKPFTTIRQSDFQVVDGQLRLNSSGGGGATDWDNISDKPNYFPSSWSLISAKPETFPSHWEDILGKPTYYPSNWSLLADKPEIYNTDWEHVANAPDAFNTEWNNIYNKPFVFLNQDHFNVEQNNQLSINNLFIHLNEVEYSSLQDRNKINSFYPYIIYHDIEKSNGGGVEYYNSLILKQVSNIYNIIRQSQESIGTGFIVDRNNRIITYSNNKFNIVNMIGDNTYLTEANHYYSAQNNDYIIFTSSPYTLYFNKNADNLFTGAMTLNNGLVNNISVSLIETARNMNVNFEGTEAGNLALWMPNLVNFYNGYRCRYSSYTSMRMVVGENLKNIEDIFNYSSNLNKPNGIANNVYELRFLNIYNYGHRALGSFDYPCENINNLYFCGNNFLLVTGSYSNNNKFNFQYFGNTHNLFIGPLNLITPNEDSGYSYIVDNYYFDNTVMNSWVSLEYYAASNVYNLQNIVFIPSYSTKSDKFYGRLAFKTPYGIDPYTTNINIEVADKSYFNASHSIWMPDGMDKMISVSNTILSWNSCDNFNIHLSYINTNNLILSNYLSGYRYISRGFLSLSHLQIRNESNGLWMVYNLFINQKVFYYSPNIKISIDNIQGLTTGYLSNNFSVTSGIYSDCYNLHNLYIFSNISYGGLPVCTNCNNLHNIWCNLLQSSPNFISIGFPNFYNCQNLQTLYTNFNNRVIVEGIFEGSFKGSNFTRDIEFNLPILSGRVNGIFDNVDIAYNKKIHILPNSFLDIDTQTSLNAIFYAPNASNFGYIELSNGRYYENFKLYIYNDYSFKESDFTGMDFKFHQVINNTSSATLSTISIINDIDLTKVAYSSSDANLINLGPYDLNNNSLYSTAYYNTVDKNMYLYYPTSNLYLLSTKGVKGTDSWSSYQIGTTFGNKVKHLSFLYNANLKMPLKTNAEADMDNLFPWFCSGMTNLEEGIDFNRFATARGQYLTPFNAYYLYNGCYNLRQVYNTEYMTNCYSAFNNCTNLTGDLVFRNITYTGYAFNNCQNIRSITFSISGQSAPEGLPAFFGFNYYTFYNCRNLRKIKCEFMPGSGGYKVTAGYGYIDTCFTGCVNLEYMRLSVPSDIDLTNVKGKIVAKYYGSGMYTCNYLVYEVDAPVEYGCGNSSPSIGPNMVVANDGNFISLNHWYGGQFMRRDYLYNDYNCNPRNLVIASMGNGSVGYGKFNYYLPNLVMAADTEIPVANCDSASMSSSYYNCHSLIYGLMPTWYNNYTTGLYNNCSNLLIQDYKNILVYKQLKREVQEKIGVDLDNYYTSIGIGYLKYSFENCSNLCYFDSQKVDALDYVANNCNNLRLVILRNKLQQVYGSFNNTPNINKLIVENNSQLKVLTYAFYNSGITEVKLPKSVRNLQYSFVYCYNLKTVEYERGIVIDPNFQSLNYAFASCNNLENVYNVPTVKNTSNSIFNNHPTLRRVTISPECTELNRLFDNCRNLHDIGGDYNNVIVFDSTFQGCSNIVTAICGENTTVLTSAYRNCDKLVRSACGNNVVSMVYAYANCPNLTTLAPIGPKVGQMIYTYENCCNITNWEIVYDRNISYTGTYNLCHNISGDINIDGLNTPYQVSIDYSCFNNTNISSFRVNNVYTVSYIACGWCENLTDVWFGNNCGPAGYAAACSYNIKNLTIMNERWSSMVADHHETNRMNIYVVNNSSSNSAIYSSCGRGMIGGGYPTGSGVADEFWTIDAANHCYYNTTANLYIYYNAGES